MTRVCIHFREASIDCSFLCKANEKAAETGTLPSGGDSNLSHLNHGVLARHEEEASDALLSFEESKVERARIVASSSVVIDRKWVEEHLLTEGPCSIVV